MDVAVLQLCTFLLCHFSAGIVANLLDFRFTKKSLKHTALLKKYSPPQLVPNYASGPDVQNVQKKKCKCEQAMGIYSDLDFMQTKVVCNSMTQT